MILYSGANVDYFREELNIENLFILQFCGLDVTKYQRVNLRT